LEKVVVDIKGQCPTKWIVVKHLRHHNLVHKTNISKTKDQHNGNDNNDIDINDDGGEAPNDSNNHKQLQNVDPTISQSSFHI
jgi:hypothetical protein